MSAMIFFLSTRRIALRSSEKIVPMIDEMGLLNDDGIVIIEHFFKKKFPEMIGSLKIQKRYRYGDTMLSLYRKVRT